jgi:uncharacterized protein YqeY
MNFKEKIDQNIKAAMLGGDKERVSVLRAIKSAILYAEVAVRSDRSRESGGQGGLPDADILSILQKEAKKRQESADLYVQGGSQEKADAELAEKKIIEEYLPAQLTEDDIVKVLDEVVAENGGGSITKETMGATIAAVKAKSGGAADGATVARLVRERIVF